MGANFTRTQCVSLCLQDSTQETILLQICIDSSPFRTNLEVSKICSCTFIERDRIVELRASTQQKFRNSKKVDCLNAYGFWGHCNRVFDAMGCFYLCCPCQDERRALIEENKKSVTEKQRTG